MTEEITLPSTPAEWHALTPAERAEVAEAWEAAGRPTPVGDLAGMSDAEIQQVRETTHLLVEEAARIEQARPRWRPVKRIRVVREGGRIKELIAERLV